MKFDPSELNEPVPALEEQAAPEAPASVPVEEPAPTVAEPVHPVAESEVRVTPTAPVAAAPDAEDRPERAPAEPLPPPAPEPPQRQIPLQGVDPPPSRRSPRPRSAVRSDSGYRKGMKTRFTREETEANAEILALLKEVTQSSVSEAQVTRALWSLLRRADDTINQNRNRAPILRRPSNGDSVGLAAYEDQITDYLHSVVRSTRKSDR
ncbi:hypothetical protein PSMK_p00780 (plasmid) [Phycisphaera mikurensis NBRC 102666]|uniref:Uncharacterized protein n=2 Tax=Phycisphaera TaxID=666508 RepID=I0IJK2_PHYMF|nr:hypothetical protein PSMK_p00780 [Phycisphaera mikurensis NBRC 102666]